METVRKPLNEDRVALLLGSVIFILALLKFSGIDMLGWAVKIGMWVGDPLDAWRPATKGLLPGYGALFATYAILTGALACCVKLMGNDVVKFVKSFTIIFFIAMICYTLGANLHRGQPHPAQGAGDSVGAGPEHRGGAHPRPRHGHRDQ